MTDLFTDDRDRRKELFVDTSSEGSSRVSTKNLRMILDKLKMFQYRDYNEILHEYLEAV